jgi:Tetratricopeptide repeat
VSEPAPLGDVIRCLRWPEVATDPEIRSAVLSALGWPRMRLDRRDDVRSKSEPADPPPDPIKTPSRPAEQPVNSVLQRLAGATETKARARPELGTLRLPSRADHNPVFARPIDPLIEPLSISHSNIGDVLRAQGNPPDALAAYEASLAIREILAKADPGNAGWQRDVAVGNERLGDIYIQQEDAPEARQAFERALGAYEALITRNPGDDQSWVLSVVPLQ